MKLIKIIVGFLCALFTPSLICFVFSITYSLYKNNNDYMYKNFNFEVLLIPYFLFYISLFAIIFFGIPVFLFVRKEKFKFLHYILCGGLISLIVNTIVNFNDISNIKLALFSCVLGMCATSVFWLIAVKNND